MHVLAGASDKFGLGRVFRQLGQKGGRGRQGARFDNVDVRSFLHSWASCGANRRQSSLELPLVFPVKASNLDKNKAGRLPPKRPAIAFLVTPKLPLGGRSEKLNEERDR